MPNILDTVKAALAADDPYDCINYGARDILDWLRALVAEVERLREKLRACPTCEERCEEQLAVMRELLRAAIEDDECGDGFHAFDDSHDHTCWTTEWMKSVKDALGEKDTSIDYGPAPGPRDPHDRIEELERDDDAA